MVPGESDEVVIVVVVDVSTIADPPPIGVRVALYPVIAAPPFEVGAVTMTVAFVVELAAAEVIAGAEGGAAGVVIEDPATVATPFPTAFWATAEIVYCVPDANPVIDIALAICAAVTVITIGAPPPTGVAVIS